MVVGIEMFLEETVEPTEETAVTRCEEAEEEQVVEDTVAETVLGNIDVPAESHDSDELPGHNADRHQMKYVAAGK